MSQSSDLFAPERFDATRRPIREASTLPPSCYWNPDFYAREVERMYNRTSTTVPQDNNACEWQQRGMREPGARSGGRYSLREQLVHHIANYVLDRVIGPTGHATSGGSVQTWGWRKLPADVGRFGR